MADDHHAGVARPLALHAHGLVAQLRPATRDERGHELDELPGVDRAAAQLGVDLDVFADRRRRRQRGDELGLGVDGRAEGLVVAPVAQRLDPAGGGAGADGDQEPRLLAQFPDPGQVLRRADRPLDEQDVERPDGAGGRGLGELDDVELLADGEQLVFEIEQLQLAAVTRCELHDPDTGPRCGLGHSKKQWVADNPAIVPVMLHRVNPEQRDC